MGGKTHRLYYWLKGGKWGCSDSVVRVHGLPGPLRKVPLIHIARAIPVNVEDLEKICINGGIYLRRDKTYHNGWIYLSHLPDALKAIGWNDDEIRESMDLLDAKHGSIMSEFCFEKKRGRSDDDDDDDDCEDIKVGDDEEEDEEDWQHTFVHEMKTLMGPESFHAFQETEMFKTMKEMLVQETLEEYRGTIRAHVRARVEEKARDEIRRQLEPVIQARFQGNTHLNMRLQQQEAVRAAHSHQPPRKDKEMMDALIDQSFKK